jgi:squalene-associated FAD-dependent desaturase
VAESGTVVVGGGLAGIAAALRLADGGRQVTLIEKRPRLGGAAFSFSRAGLSVDNGQHVFLRCCEAYRGFVARLGGLDRVHLQSHLDIPVLRPDGKRARLSRVPGLPAPLHLGAALSTYALLTPADRARVIRGALALRFLNPADRTLDRRTLGDFLRAQGQNDNTIEAMWGIVATATLNLPPDEASLALAAKVFRTGLLDHAPASDLGYAVAPLGELHSVLASKALLDAGVEIITDIGVDSVADGVVVAGARTWQAQDIVLALPHQQAFEVAPDLGRGSTRRALELGASPIVNVHVVYDRKVTDLEFAAAVGSPVQWFFDRTQSSGLKQIHSQGQYLAITVSSADAIVDVPSRTLQEQFIDALATLLPAASKATVLDSFVTRERRATFRQAAGSWEMRPATAEGPPGMWLAGAWTDTGWPDTMESAVRSGIAAAEAALRLPAHERTAYAA